MKISKQEVVRLNLIKQHLYHLPKTKSKEDAFSVLKDLGCIQLDTLNVITRSHNLVFLARMEQYSESWYWDFYENDIIFEGYMHALSIFPMDEYPHLKPSRNSFKKYMMGLEDEKVSLLLDFHNELKKYSSINSRSLKEIQSNFKFEENDSKDNSAWSVTPIRWALDYLWRSGMLIQVRDKNFNKVYYLPQDRNQKKFNQDNNDFSINESYKRHIKVALLAMGVANLADITDYFRLKKEMVQTLLQEYISQDEVLRIEVEGLQDTYYILATDMEMLQSPLIKEEPEHSALLSPFDNLIWNRDRMNKLFDFNYRLECYIPKERRVYGYYALPILIRDRIIGTIDLKVERKIGTIFIKSLTVFDPFEKSKVVNDIANLLVKLMLFLNVKNLESSNIEDSELVLQVRKKM